MFSIIYLFTQNISFVYLIYLLDLKSKTFIFYNLFASDVTNVEFICLFDRYYLLKLKWIFKLIQYFTNS
jgi:hypothetical protein